ncbi:TonB-dependent receptor [Aquimarina sp. U1-2]|uniref:SusC/RagA family TonB-linked outer membrane protein n=1 Tax=Aquimarina sp. U1-2 TaxID=2823141 RepID=UPI001AEC8CFA|nr:TonB-dependent receptor [Aquimarina sp. U1-2]MBP2833394.1 TonB-dependent receptor [Aquimarina sp. U1-2]
MKKKINTLLTLLAVLTFSLVSAQSKTITGTVIEASGLPLPGVTVIVKGTKTGAQTDFDGNYQLEANVSDVLVFSYVGLETQEVIVGGSNTYNVTMKEDAAVLEEVIVVAYGQTSKKDFTGSASVINSQALQTRNVTSPIAAIEGRATGVQFTSPAGPGESPGIIIRGVGTLNGSTDPLYIVDGVQYNSPLNTLNQEDIESFTVLKDAASTSLYGSRAANGVVIITTKKGSKAGGIKVNASTQTGFVTRGVPFYDQVTPGQYYEVMWEALKNSRAGGGDPAFASANIYRQLGYNPFNVPNDQIVGIDGRLNPDAELVYQSLDWFDALQRTGVRTNYNVNISGGGEDHSVFFSASYLDDESYVIRSGFERLTARLNAEFQVNERLKIGGSANIALTEARGPSSAGANSIVNPFSFAQNIGSIYPVFVNDRQGNIVTDVFGNPVWDNGEGFSEFNIGSRPTNQGRHAIQELTLNNEFDQDNTYGFRMFTEYEILSGLKLKLNYGRDINDFFESEYENAIIGDAQPDGRLSQERARQDVENFNQILTYNKNFGGHNIDLTAGHESFKTSINDLEGFKTVQVTNSIFEFSNFARPISVDGATFERALEGYFFRANYNYDNKYYLSGSIRTDGSSVFERDKRWGTFYSVGASWRIDQENFIKDVSWIDQLKLRGSYGEIGNDNLVPDQDDLSNFYLSQARYQITSNAATPALLLNSLGNADIVWETSESYDVALEFGLFNNFLEGSVEYYRRNSTDLLYELPIAPSNGINVYPVNAGDLVNSGWELGLTANFINKNDFRWSLTLLGTTLENEITNLPAPFIPTTDTSKRWATGRSIYDFFLIRTAGVDPENGDQLYFVYEFDENNESVPVLDDEGNHQTTSDWRRTERAYTGDSTIPDFIGSISNSISYKGFDFDFLITYGIGGSILDNAYADLMHEGEYGDAFHPDILNAWRQPGDITNVPRLENGNVRLAPTQTDRFLTDASFWALRNASIGYNFSSENVERLGLDNLRISVTGENLYLKSKRDGLDPQYSLAGTAPGDDFVPGRIISLGLNVSF